LKLAGGTSAGLFFFKMPRLSTPAVSQRRRSDRAAARRRAAGSRSASANQARCAASRHYRRL